MLPVYGTVSGVCVCARACVRVQNQAGVEIIVPQSALHKSW